MVIKQITALTKNIKKSGKYEFCGEIFLYIQRKKKFTSSLAQKSQLYKLFIFIYPLKPQVKFNRPIKKIIYH